MAKDLHSFLKEYEAKYPEDILHIEKEIKSNQEITRIVELLEKQDKYPLLYFHNVINPDGKRAEQPVVTNVLASRTRYARICDSTFEMLGRNVYEATRSRREKPEIISKAEAPVRGVIKTGNKINLYEFPMIWHNAMDAGYYFSAGFMTTYDPDTGIDNTALQRGWAKEKDTIISFLLTGASHNNLNQRKYEAKNEDMKVCYWLGHHPLGYTGALTKLPYPGSHWEAMGGMLGEPLRLVPSESLGDDFLVPADAEVVVEGIMESNKRYAEGPFGEFPSYYGAQIPNSQWKVTAITHRKDAIWYNIVAAHVDHPGTGGPPLEGLLWESLKPRFPSLQKVYMPVSGTGRYHAYIQLKNPGPGEARQVIMRALDVRGDLVKHIFVFDEDVDIFNPRDVMWAIATRTQWGRDVLVFPDTKTVALDPSCGPESIGDIGGIDCTKPWGEAYEERVGVEPAVQNKIKLGDFVDAAALARVNVERV